MVKVSSRDKHEDVDNTDTLKYIWKCFQKIVRRHMSSEMILQDE